MPHENFNMREFMKLITWYLAAANGAEIRCDSAFINNGTEEGAGNGVIHGYLWKSVSVVKCPES